MGEHRLSFFLVSRNHVPGAESCWLLLWIEMACKVYPPDILP
jgi:hypothetical protein